MQFVIRFSNAIAEFGLIKYSRVVALEMGYNYIDFFHFVIADSLLNEKLGIKNFIFNETDTYESFYNNFKKEKIEDIGENLFITLNVEQAIKKSKDLWKNKIYESNNVKPKLINRKFEKLNYLI